MVKKDINSFGVASLIYFLIRGSFLGMGIYNIFQISTTNTAISSIIGALIGYIPILIFLFIMKKGNGKNIFEINKDLFGNKVGTVINFVLSIFAMFFAVIIYYNLASFLDLQYIPETSKLYIKILILIALIYCLSKGIKSITRAAQIFLFITIAIFFICFIGLISNLDISNIFPIYDGGYKKVLIGSLTYSIFSSLPLFFLGAIGRNEISDETKYTKNILKMYTFANIMLIIVIICTIFVLGYPLISILKYPEYMATKKVVLFNIFERVENIMAFQWFFDTFFLIIMSMYFAYKNFESYNKNIKYKKILVYIIPIICFFGSLAIFKNITESTEFNIQYTPYIVLGFISTSMFLILIKMAYNRFIKYKLLE